MIVEVYSTHTEKQKKKKRTVVKPANNKAASTRESKKIRQSNSQIYCYSNLLFKQVTPKRVA
jgi:hypothetical protein